MLILCNEIIKIVNKRRIKLSSTVVCEKIENNGNEMTFSFLSTSSIEVIRHLKVKYYSDRILIHASTLPTALLGCQNTVTVKNNNDLPVYLCSGKSETLIYKGRIK